MALPQIISRNQSQKIASFEINGRVVLQPNTWYTCPTGKKAIVKGKVQCTGNGASASAEFVAAGVVMYDWGTGAATAIEHQIISPRGMRSAQNEFGFFEVELAAGETIITQQDAGTNAEFNVWASVTETDA